MNDRATIKRLEELTASERAFAAARKAGSKIDQEILNKLASDKQKLTGTNLNLDESDQDALARRQKLENYQAYRKKIIDQENGLRNGSVSPTRLEEGEGSSEDFMAPYTSAVEDKLDSEFASQLNETIKEGPVDSNKSHSRVIQTITRGNFFQLINPKVKPKMFLLCMDFSPESILH